MDNPALAVRETEQKMKGRGSYGGTCIDTNLLHMEEMAFPCKMCFSSCVSPALMMMMMNHSTFPLSSLYRHLCFCLFLFCSFGAETASRHQEETLPVL